MDLGKKAPVTCGLDWLNALTIVTAVSSGPITGQMLAIALAKYTARSLLETSWTRSFHLENGLFERITPFALMAPLVALVSCCLLASGPVRHWYIAGTTMLFIMLAITMTANIPINNQVAAWRPGGAPVIWPEVRDR